MESQHSSRKDFHQPARAAERPTHPGFAPSPRVGVCLCFFVCHLVVVDVTLICLSAYFPLRACLCGRLGVSSFFISTYKLTHVGSYSYRCLWSEAGYGIEIATVERRPARLVQPMHEKRVFSRRTFRGSLRRRGCGMQISSQKILPSCFAYILAGIWRPHQDQIGLLP